MNINLFVVVTVVAEWLPGESWRGNLDKYCFPESDFYLGGGVRPYSRIDPIRYNSFNSFNVRQNSSIINKV